MPEVLTTDLDSDLAAFHVELEKWVASPVTAVLMTEASAKIQESARALVGPSALRNGSADQLAQHLVFWTTQYDVWERIRYGLATRLLDRGTAQIRERHTKAQTRPGGDSDPAAPQNDRGSDNARVEPRVETVRIGRPT